MRTDEHRVGLVKDPAPPPAGPAWIVVPARAVALVVVLPFRLAYELAKAVGRGVGGLMRTLGQALYRWLLRPVGRLFAAVFDFLVARPLRWLYRVLLVPIGRFVAWIARGIGAGLAWVFAVVIVLPLAVLWRYVLSPPLRGLWWLIRGLGSGLAAVGRVIAAAFGWAWRTAGLILRPVGLVIVWLGRTFIVLPARWIRVHVLRPTKNVLQATWRVTVSAPLRWIDRSLLLPIRQATRDVRLQLRRAFRG
jgi:hypothetical protein